MADQKKKILWLPVWFGFCFILFNFFFVMILERALTTQAEDVFLHKQVGFWMASSLFIFPNLLLSFLLWTYEENHHPSIIQLKILCYVPIIFGFIPQVLIYLAYYTLWYRGGAHIPVVMFGFPFIYMVGVMVGWVFALWFASMASKK